MPSTQLAAPYRCARISARSSDYRERVRKPHLENFRKGSSLRENADAESFRAIIDSKGSAFADTAEMIRQKADIQGVVSAEFRTEALPAAPGGERPPCRLCLRPQGCPRARLALREQFLRQRLLGVLVELLDLVGEHALVDRLVPVVEGIEAEQRVLADLQAHPSAP